MIAPKTVKKLLALLIVFLPMAVSACAQGYDTSGTRGLFGSTPTFGYYDRYEGGVNTSNQLGPGARMAE
ncbi:MAG: hypothetical protein M0006_09455 [Magnetospirillum sp.]|nr:hypothetical protein [Magnetospirillum sp.]